MISTRIAWGTMCRYRPTVPDLLSLLLLCDQMVLTWCPKSVFVERKRLPLGLDLLREGLKTGALKFPREMGRKGGRDEIQTVPWSGC